MINNITEIFIDDIYNLTQTKFLDSAVFQAKKCILDYLGVTFAGAKIQRDKVENLLSYIGTKQEDSSVIGFNKKINIENATFINGLDAHAVELDDGVNFGIIHLGSPIISAVLSLVEKEDLDAESLLLGIIIGYEVALRIARSIQPSHKERGYHATGTCGTIGAAIGISAALGFTREQMKNAMSSAAIAASGTLKVLEDESESKPYNVGKAALSGLIAANMARAGFEGPDDVLSGDTGFFKMMTDKMDIRYLRKEKNDSFAVEKVYFKPYAACRYCHPAIEAAIKIISNCQLSPSDIKDIKVSTYLWAVNKHDHTNIKGISSAKMSIPYSVAVALVSGKAGFEEYTSDRIKNSETLSLTKKVRVFAEDNLTELFPQKTPAVVEITTYDGRSYKERVDYPKGEPENPLSEDEVKEKFITLATFGNKSRQEAEKIIQYVWDLENCLEKLFPLL